jgi:CubicO group peptidase (beta-lactamase class C family)
VPDDKRDITIHHLLTHTSGLPPFHSFGADGVHGDFQVMHREEAERVIMARPLDFSPGEDWTYSNSGYTLLAAIVERVADRPFEAVLRSELLEPAGLTHTGLYFQPLWHDVAVARGYRESGDQGSPLEWTNTEELWGLIGNGGVLSTIDDLARWHRALQDGMVLPRHAVEELFAPHVQVRDGLHYGYGWYVEDGGNAGRVIRHGGANDFGFAARWRWYEDHNRVLFLLINREPPGMDVGLAADAVEEVLDAVAWGRESELPPAVVPPTESIGLDRYVGRYRLDEGAEVLVRTAESSLAVEARGPVPIRHLGFPAASNSELEAITRLDHLAEEIVDGMARADEAPLARAMADSSRVGSFWNYIIGWWREFEASGGMRHDVAVLGTVPSWWSLGDERLATIIVAQLGDRTEVFRLHWHDGRIVGLGGGAVREPATTLFAPTDSGDFIGYHLGIRQPVGLSFETNAMGEVEVLRLHTLAQTLTGRRIQD